MTQQTTTAASQQPSLADLVEHLSAFEGPPEQFLLQLLAVQCHVATAEGGAIFRLGPNGQAEVLAVYPAMEEGETAPVWLAQAAEAAPKIAQSGQATTMPLQGGGDLYGQKPNQHLILVPVRGGGGVRGVSAFHVQADDPAMLSLCRERLELTISLLSLYEMRLTLQQRRGDMQRLRQSMEVLATVNEQRRMKAAAMGFCNEIASRFNAERVSFGVLKGRYCKLIALSHTEKFTRKMRLVQDIESAMEECLDQDLEVIYPPMEEATYVHRAAGELSKRHGPIAVCALPIRREGEVEGVVLIERSIDEPFTMDEVESIRLTVDLCAPRLLDLHETDRWFGARLAHNARKWAALAVGPRYTWVKLAAIGVLAAILFLVFARGAYRVDGSFEVQATKRQVIPAPFEGYLNEVNVRPGDRVIAGQTVLASLDTSELLLQRASTRAELVSYLKEADIAMRDGKTVERQIAEANADKARAEIRLFEYKINQSDLRSPVTGEVLTGDLERELGAPVKTGDVMFEVAPIESLRAEIAVPEDEIVDVLKEVRERRKIIAEARTRLEELSDEQLRRRIEQLDEVPVMEQVTREAMIDALVPKPEPVTGHLATAANPGHYIPFEVERINPVAEVMDQQNVFKVRVRFLSSPEWKQAQQWMKTGMKGVAKIDIGEASYAWIWTRKLINWIRMKLWI